MQSVSDDNDKSNALYFEIYVIEMAMSDQLETQKNINFEKLL